MTQQEIEQQLTLHTQEMAEIRKTLDRVAQQQQQNTQQIAFNSEQLAILTAGMLDLRSIVADYIRGRSQS